MQFLNLLCFIIIICGCPLLKLTFPTHPVVVATSTSTVFRVFSSMPEGNLASNTKNVSPSSSSVLYARNLWHDGEKLTSFCRQDRALFQ